jgi:hypothetical protein
LQEEDDARRAWISHRHKAAINRGQVSHRIQRLAISK